MAEELEDSILKTIKKMLGIMDDYTEFDLDIITHINSVLSTLFQLGVGPEDGFMIESKEETWTDFFGSQKTFLNFVKSYVHLSVKLLFDPPSTSFTIAAFERQRDEFAWRISLYAPKVIYPPTVPEGV